MRVLVTGATGFLGYHLCSRLVAQGHQVTALHRKASQTARIQALGVKCLQNNLGDVEELRRAVVGQDAVIHAAADIKYWPMHAGLQEQVNVTATRDIALACRLEETGRMLYVSSVAAIGISHDHLHPADESFQFNLDRTPLKYHISKKRGEDAVREEIATGLNAVIVNPSFIFGPHGQVYRGGEMITKLTGAKIVPYFTGGICAVHVADVVSGTLAALQRGISGSRYILGGDNLSYQEIARQSLEVLGLDPPMIPIHPVVTAVLAALMTPLGKIRNQVPRFNPATHYCCSRFQYYLSEKARAELGYAPRGFDAIIRDCLSYCRSRETSVGSPEIAL